MLIQELRPKKFSDVKGNVAVKKALQIIAKDPTNKPISIILQGSWGGGKTTLSRIFGKALNCKNIKVDVCGSCASCLSIDKGSSLYKEYDCSTVGNVEDLNQIKNEFLYTLEEGYRVFVFDEFHLASKQSQASILKTLEDPPPNCFFLFCTTDPEKILNTIKSRSLVLEIIPLQNQDIQDLLTGVIPDLDTEVIKTIVRRAKGHARDALSLLEKFTLYGKDDFLSTTLVLDSVFKKFISFLLKNDVTAAKQQIDLIMCNPVVYIENDFDFIIKELCDRVFLKQDAPVKVKTLIFEYFKHKSYLIDDTTWYVFFLFLIETLGHK